MDKGIVVLGGGIAGITAAYFLGKEKAVVYEKEEQWGGLCNSFCINNFIFDKAIHLSFTKYSEVREIFDRVNYYKHEPNPSNYYKGHWLKHPIQNNLYPLPAEEKVKAIKDFINRPIYNKKFLNYEEWLYEQFGQYIAENFSLKYTEKYWCEEGKKLETSWIKNRVYRPSIEEVLYGAMSEKTPNTYYAKEMRYPKEGGYKAFLKPMGEETNILLNKKAVLIDSHNKLIEFSDGTKIHYETLISSIPLPKLINIIKDAPKVVREAANNLVATSILLISVGFNKPDVVKNLWFYIYDEDLLPARAYSPNLKSKNNVPSGCSSLQFEIHYSKYKPININRANILEHVSNVIEKLNIARKSEIIFMDYRNVEYGNVIFYKDIHKNKKIIQNYLDKIGIRYIGRFGEWDYLWSDQSLLSGKKVAKELITEIP
ncbi:protoporphyrinogen/coproporphyrinogen oxidase [Oceanirhabdus seepicola]|uniref:NAD(P)-binding protein n=1 Tax=Oceanirhabdus seepicola TaxID=2828781 RepID=A0A9J6NXR6_9CLOT|nr:NAD(P)-binding protein [Oceanirhabdus seepicola]MCM1989303.1 NAD(P)-binding protein [Oceanirhabdus seepicola]